MGRINRLIPTTTLTANSVIAMDAESGGATNKVTIQTLARGLRSFGDYATQTDLNAKQDVLTFDDAPEEDSENPVTSGGIYNAIGSAMSNVYTKAETDNAIAQSAADALKGIVLRRVNGTITDTTNGFIDTGISSNDYVILGYFSPANSNNVIEITNLDSGTRNYRIRKIDAVSGNVSKSGTYNVYLTTIARSLITQ